MAVVIIVRDITERAQAEALLDRYRLLSERAHDIILFVRPDGAIVEANVTAERAYGYSREELLTKNIRDLRAEQEEYGGAARRGENGSGLRNLAPAQRRHTFSGGGRVLREPRSAASNYC